MEKDMFAAQLRVNIVLILIYDISHTKDSH